MAFAVAAKSRLAAAPEIPTVDEAGLPGFYVTFWAGLWAPKGTPKDVIAKLNSAAVTALADPTVSTGFADLAFVRSEETVADWISVMPRSYVRGGPEPR
jgi:tripartite-type tricarboxylate transporter receptor subunit TctC